MQPQVEAGIGSHEGSGTGVESCKDSYVISSLLSMSFSPDSLSLTFPITRWNLKVLQLPNLLCDSLSCLETLCSGFSQRENLIGRTSVRCPFLSQSATALGRAGGGGWDSGAGQVSFLLMVHVCGGGDVKGKVSF